MTEPKYPNTRLGVLDTTTGGAGAQTVGSTTPFPHHRDGVYLATLEHLTGENPGRALEEREQVSEAIFLRRAITLRSTRASDFTAGHHASRRSVG